MAFMIWKQHTTKMLSRSLYTNSQRVLMMDPSLKLPFLTSKEMGTLDVIAPAPLTTKEFNEKYGQGVTGRMLKQLQSQPHCTLDFSNPPNFGKYLSQNYDAFVFYDDQMTFNPAGATMTPLEIREKFMHVLRLGVYGFEIIPKEIQIILRNKDDKLFKEWKFDDIAKDVSPLLKLVSDKNEVLRGDIVSKGHKKKHHGYDTKLVVKTYTVEILG